ncbi:MAG: phospho-sugar mutase [Myxococcota bacterium]|nr:phospho-sugar mutase [Myxococcota bacterium]
MQNTIDHWLERDPDPQTRQELQELLKNNDQSELQSRFKARLAFGTAGLRGLLGAGPGRMNRLVVQETTAGLGQYLLTNIPDAATAGVVIGYDGRRGSLQFSEDAACVLAGMGIKVYLFETVIPTPTCAFAVLQRKAAAGIMVTASHNPPDYNGYKVYWSNGAQIIPPHDSGIADAIELAATRPIPWLDFNQAQNQGMIEALTDDTVEAYLQGVEERALFWSPGQSHDLKIVYTPLHGVGAEVVERALKRAGFHNTHTVPSQREPDGHFPTVNFPNPEEPGAMDEAIASATAQGADLIVANDPDADRLAVALPTSPGAYQMLTGNEIGVILGHALLQAYKGKQAAVGTTIVSSRLLSAIAAGHDATYFETLTGFKWIANHAIELKKEGKDFLLGYEEALGYTVGDWVRDKDGVSSLLAFALLTSHLRSQNKTVLQYLEDIYRTYGLYTTAQKSLALEPGADAGALGKLLRQSPPATIAGQVVTATCDLLTLTRTTLDGTTEDIDLPPSDVLVFYLEDQTRIIVRPSGTEPKVKCYYETIHSVPEAASFSDTQAQATRAMEDLITAHQKELATLGE